MAKKKKNKKSNKVALKKGKSLSLKSWAFILVALIMLIVFMPTTVLLLIGMLPTFVAFIVDREPGRNKTFTIGAMNFAGCFPYILALWTKVNSVDMALSLISEPKTIIIMYGAAGLGYIIDFIITYAVSSILIQRSEIRLKKIDLEKGALEKRWGRTVNGREQLDEKGFPVASSMVSDAEGAAG